MPWWVGLLIAGAVLLIVAVPVLIVVALVFHTNNPERNSS